MLRLMKCENCFVCPHFLHLWMPLFVMVLIPPRNGQHRKQEDAMFIGRERERERDLAMDIHVLCLKHILNFHQLSLVYASDTSKSPLIL